MFGTWEILDSVRSLNYLLVTVV